MFGKTDLLQDAVSSVKPERRRSKKGSVPDGYTPVHELVKP